MHGTSLLLLLPPVQALLLLLPPVQALLLLLPPVQALLLLLPPVQALLLLLPPVQELLLLLPPVQALRPTPPQSTAAGCSRLSRPTVAGGHQRVRGLGCRGGARMMADG